MESAGERDRNMSSNFGDFQLGVYADAVKGVNSRYPFDFRSIERKASEALPDLYGKTASAARHRFGAGHAENLYLFHDFVPAARPQWPTWPRPSSYPK